MKRLLLLTVIFSLLMSCSGKKQVEKALNSGNYDYAIQNALRKLENNKDKKRKYAYAVMLQNAYYKVMERDLERINHLKKENNPELYRTIFEMYLDLNARQEAIKPILPLRIDGKILSFNFMDYSDQIIVYREKASNHMFDKGLSLLDSENKYNIREAYTIFNYVESINPGYENTRELMAEAHERGIDHIIVTIQNLTHQIIHRGLENELLNFDAYGLDNFWTVYHSRDNASLNFDYAMALQLNHIDISPEHLSERQFLRERDIIDGWEYQLDQNGNVMQDSLGNDIKVDRIITTRARFYEIHQQKSAQVLAKVVFTDLSSNQILDNFNIESVFVFENFFGRYRGDERALTSNDQQLLRNRRLPFPSNEQMVFDTGEDLKSKLKSIINAYRVKG